MTGPMPRPSRRVSAVLLFVALFIVYNSNGREIGGVDSQPAKMAARALVLRHTMTLDEDVRAQPLYAERVSFVRDRQGHFRSAYSPDAVIEGAVVGWLLDHVARTDLNAPRGPNLIAVIAASTTTAA